MPKAVKINISAPYATVSVPFNLRSRELAPTFTTKSPAGTTQFWLATSQ